MEQFEEDILGETIDVDRQDDIVEDYFEAAYDELAEDGSANHEDVNSFDSVESESFAGRNDLEDKRPSGVISDDEDLVDGSGDELEDHVISTSTTTTTTKTTTTTTTTSTTTTTTTTTITTTTTTTTSPPTSTAYQKATSSLQDTFDDEDHLGSGDDNDDEEFEAKEGSGGASHHVVIPPNFVTDDEDYDDEEGSSPQVTCNHPHYHNCHHHHRRHSSCPCPSYDKVLQGGLDDQIVEDSMDLITEEDSRTRKAFFDIHEVRTSDQTPSSSHRNCHSGRSVVSGHVVHGGLYRGTKVFFPSSYL